MSIIDTRRALQNINEFIKNELFPIIGIPRESWAPRTADVMINLYEIRNELQRIRNMTQNENHQLNNCINRLKSRSTIIEDQAIADISRLFE